MGNTDTEPETFFVLEAVHHRHCARIVYQAMPNSVNSLTFLDFFVSFALAVNFQFFSRVFASFVIKQVNTRHRETSATTALSISQPCIWW